MKFILPLVILFSSIGCSKHVDKQAEGEKLMQTSREWSKTAASGDIDRTLSYWADDAVFILPKQRAIKGKDDLRIMLEASYKMPGFHFSWEPQSVSISDDGTMGYLIEKSQATINDSLGHPITEYHQTVSVWKKQASGVWRNAVDIWTKDGEQQIAPIDPPR